MAQIKTIQSLEAALTDMHALASGSLDHIQGMAFCALCALETPGGVRDLESIAHVLQAIAQEANITSNNVDVEAERVGINTVDDAWERRRAARSVVRADVQKVEG